MPGQIFVIKGDFEFEVSLIQLVVVGFEFFVIIFTEKKIFKIIPIYLFFLFSIFYWRENLSIKLPDPDWNFAKNLFRDGKMVIEKNREGLFAFYCKIASNLYFGKYRKFRKFRI